MSLRARLLSAAALAFLAASSLAVHADTFSTFNIDGTLSDGSFSGTVLLDSTTGLFTGADFTVLSIGGPYNFVSVAATQNIGSNTNVVFRQTGNQDVFGLNLPNASFIGYMGGTLCSVDQPCISLGPSSLVYVDSPYGVDGSGPEAIAGTLTLAPPTAVTPEPSSFVLLGTGFLSLAGAARRRFFKV